MAYTNKNLIAISNFSVHKDQLNYSNYVNLPQSILKKISKNDKIKTPYYFKLTSPNGLKTWVGVNEFTAEENYIVVPHWILDFLGLNGSEKIKVRLIKDIPKGKTATFQPQEKEFFEIPECEGCLETILSNFCILHTNQIIQIEVLNKKYHILVTNVEPDWEKIDFDNPPNLDDNIIEIKDIDLTVEINNKFLQEENKNKKSLIEENDETVNEEDKKTEECSEEKPKGRKLSDSTKKLTAEETRLARLKYFNKKFKSSNKKMESSKDIDI